MNNIDLFVSLEAVYRNSNTKEYYLWPRTPVGNIQAEILQRCGASDLNYTDERSRSYKILSEIKLLQANKLLSDSPVIVDLFCGDASVLWVLKKQLYNPTCIGIDLLAGKYPQHNVAAEYGVKLYSIPVQELVSYELYNRADLLIMLNTFRGWDKAGLSSSESELPKLVTDWMRRNFRYQILTCTDEQKESLRQQGFWVKVIGSGEDNSDMCCLWDCDGLCEKIWSEERCTNEK